MDNIDETSEKNMDEILNAADRMIRNNAELLQELNMKIENTNNQLQNTSDFVSDDDIYSDLSDADVKVIADEAERIVNDNQRVFDDLEASGVPVPRETPSNRVSFNGGVKQVRADQVRRQANLAPKNGSTNSGSESEEEEKPETFFVNVLDFVVSYMSKVYAESTTQSARRIWLNDWWKYSAIVARMNALWIAWERSYKANQIEVWFLNAAEPMMRYIGDKETGIMTHYIREDSSNLVRVKKGEFLPTIEPPHDWFTRIANELQSLGRLELKRLGRG
jgi:hypothetical protein